MIQVVRLVHREYGWVKDHKPYRIRTDSIRRIEPVHIAPEKKFSDLFHGEATELHFKDGNRQYLAEPAGKVRAKLREDLMGTSPEARKRMREAQDGPFVRAVDQRDYGF